MVAEGRRNRSGEILEEGEKERRSTAVDLVSRKGPRWISMQKIRMQGRVRRNRSRERRGVDVKNEGTRTRMKPAARAGTQAEKVAQERGLSPMLSESGDERCARVGSGETGSLCRVSRSRRWVKVGKPKQHEPHPV